MRSDCIDNEEFPLRVQLGSCKDTWTYAFSWLHGKIFRLEKDYREVFQTTSNADDEHFVYFSKDHRRLAILFAMKWGR